VQLVYYYLWFQEFRKTFENPIQRGQDAAASDKDREKGRECLEKLIAIVNRCLIRRTAALLSQYLPKKVEQVICCRLAPIQAQLYESFIKSDSIRKAVLAGMCGVSNHKDIIIIRVY
jgi:DNA repair and recombination RAD54-like protein